MNRYELAERFAEMWKKSRNTAGYSQEHMAKALGVSKRTIQNWEEGTSCPNQIMGFEWFQVLGLQPLPYYLEVLYPTEFCGTTSESDDQKIEDALITYIKGTSSVEKRELLYMLFGDHGSSPNGILNMVTAHLHCELRSRLNIAQSIINNYEIAESHGTLICEGNIQPDMEVLKRSFENAKAAVKNKSNAYTNA